MGHWMLKGFKRRWIIYTILTYVFYWHDINISFFKYHSYISTGNTGQYQYIAIPLIGTYIQPKMSTGWLECLILGRLQPWKSKLKSTHLVWILLNTGGAWVWDSEGCGGGSALHLLTQSAQSTVRGVSANTRLYKREALTKLNTKRLTNMYFNGDVCERWKIADRLLLFFNL